MTNSTQRIMADMIALYAGDAARIQHFTKVYAYASLIGQQEGLSPESMEILELAALTHDIAIHLCEQKYGSYAGNLQEQEGPALAEAMLSAAGIAQNIRERVCFLIAHHHTYKGVDAQDWQILLESDYLVNGFEGNASADANQRAYDTFFVTQAGRRLCRCMFGLEEGE